ncbi:MAG: hypothetical protein DSM106950_04975 [Stigonema ocellatum SAG 48.90 = DSM 106950]|nr:hypothetical protein [Stigonema ocellatum SAG 48.90 = DSM 106950]
MPGSISLGLLVLGGVLILIGFLGGNFKLFGAEVAATISNRWLRFVAIIFGSVLVFAALGQNFSNSGSGINTIWTCYNNSKPVGDVTIWWGHKERDAEWACNKWISQCGNGGGCTTMKNSK